MEVFFFDGGCFWKVADSKMELVVVKMVVWLV